MILRRVVPSTLGKIKTFVVEIEKFSPLNNITTKTTNLPYVLKIVGRDLLNNGERIEHLISYNRDSDREKTMVSLKNNDITHLDPEDYLFPRLIEDKGYINRKIRLNLNTHLQHCAKGIMVRRDCKIQDLLDLDAFKNMSYTDVSSIVNEAKIINLKDNTKIWKNTLFCPREVTEAGIQPSQFWECLWERW
jgi:hypothetical protein